MSSGFRTKAMAEPAQSDGQLFFVEYLIGIQSAERNLGGPNQTQIGFLDAIDLSFRTAGDKSDPFQNLVLSEIGRNGWGKPFGD